jgi:AraC-like DNA-binding protein
MELRKIEGLYRASWRRLSADSWCEALRSVCGNFNAIPRDGCSEVTGLVEHRRAGGVEFAHVAHDLARVDRGRLDIRRDDHEYLFLVIQLGGNAAIEQNGNQIRLDPGDCILIDSARPVTFSSEGRLSNQLSVHLPRQQMISDSPVRFSVASKLSSADPMATTICSLIGKILMLEAMGQSKAHMYSLLLDTVRFAFEFDEVNALLPRLSGYRARCEIIEDMIDRNLVDPELGPTMIARSFGQPLRRVQEDLHATGRTLSGIIREKRLRLAAEKLRGSFLSNSKMNIAQIAFSCGFNDISYFNRSFRDYYGITPSDAARMDTGARSVERA